MNRDVMMTAILEFTVGRLRRLTTIKKLSTEHVHGPDIPMYAMCQPGRPATLMVVDEGKDIIVVFNELLDQSEALIRENLNRAPIEHIKNLYEESLTVLTKPEHPSIVLGE